MADPMLAFISEPLVDPKRIGALLGVIKPEALHRTIDAFREAIEERAAQIRVALSDGQHTDAIRLAHSIKGVSVNFGAARLGAISSKMESLLNDGNIAAAATLVDDLEDIARDTAAALDRVQDEIGKSAERD
ncbi:Hpt domain-containing protein [Thalassobaculum sp.]|uniref:Hpt domain-containing protein n=1 Tax=Thalassobaculum sp. TaxID=2022740 RepID=UPI0032EB4F34